MKTALPAVRCVVFSVAMALASASSAAGQTFGAADGSGLGAGTARGTSLIVTGGLTTGRVWLKLNQPAMDPTVSLPASSDYLGGDGAAVLSFAGSRASLTAGLNTYGSYHPQGPLLTHGHSGNVGGMMRLGRLTALTASATVDRRPFSVVSIAPGLADANSSLLSGILPLGGEHYTSLRVQSGLGHQFSRRLQATVSWNQERFKTGSGAYKRGYGAVSAGLGYAVTKSVAIRLGYGRHMGRYDDPLNPDANVSFSRHVIDAGIGFNTSLAVARRTTLSFQTGTAAYSDGRRSRYDVVGSAALTRQWTRTWTSALSFNRGFQFADALVQPTVSNDLRATAKGQLTRRAAADASVGISQGGMGISRQSDQFLAYYASAGLGMPVSRLGSLRFGYLLTAYELDAGAVLPGGLGDRVTSHAVSVGLNVALPLVGNLKGRSDAAR